MFSFHKPKIYRSNLGCCICRAKSSSSRFTDSKKYEPEFEKCFRLPEKRSGEICNACVLLVKRWKKLPTGTNRNWHHVVDARAGPGTKSFKNKPMSSGEPKKRPFNKPNRNISALCKDAKIHQSMTTSSESESEEDEEEMMDDLDALVEPAGQRSLRRSTRLTTSSGSKHYKGTSGTDRNNNLNGKAKNVPKRRTLLKPEHLFSFLDTSFWQQEKVCCGIIFKGPNNEVIIYPELLSPCGVCRQPLPFSVSNSTSSSSSECETISHSSSSTSLSTDRAKPPPLVSVSSVSATTPASINFSTPATINSAVATIQDNTSPTTELNDLSLVSKKTLQHQDSFASSDTSSEPGSSSGISSHDDIDDQSSGVSSMAACDEASLMAPDSDLSSALSDRLSTVSSVCLLMDADDGSSNASTATYDGLNHHELEMSSSEDSPVKTSPNSVALPSLAPSAATFSATAVV